MANERVQKPTWQPQIQKKQSRIVPPPVDIQTEAKSLPSPKLAVSGLPSKEEREAIKSSIFGHGTEVGQIQTKTESPQFQGQSDALGHDRETGVTTTNQGQGVVKFLETVGVSIQAKLTIGAPGDKYEQEADRVASQVVNQINTPAPQQSTPTQSVQHEAIPEEDELQMKSEAGTIQREVVSDEELQMKPLSTGLQAALEVSQPNEPAEQEAEAVARQVLAGEAVQVSKSAIPGLYRTPLYRGMTEEGNKPKIGPTARTLGVRESEITLREEDGVKIITSDGKGMSTAPDTPRNLPGHRRDITWGGTGKKDPVWEIDDGNMTGDLKAIRDGKTHVTVAPSKDMSLKDYEEALANTQSKWEKKVGP